jgi:hypothetical protein
MATDALHSDGYDSGAIVSPISENNPKNIPETILFQK